MADAANISEAEEWRDVPGFEGLYQVSSEGRVRRIARFRKVADGLFSPSEFRPVSTKPSPRNGYPCASLSNGPSKTCLVHRLVCEAFHGPPPTGRNQVAHFDGSRSNNRASNLRWVDAKENAVDRFRHDRDAPGERHVLHKLTEDQVHQIRRDYRPKYGSLARLSEEHGVTQTCILNIVRRRTWKHI